MPTATIHHGDALAFLADMENGSVDAVITDPPYSSGGMTRGDRNQDVHTKYVQSGSASQNTAGFSGDTRDARGYGYWCALWLSECLRVTKPGGICAVFTDWRQLPTTTDALQAGGWVWRGIVPWHKPSGRPVQGRYANSCEYVAWGTNGPRSLDALDGTALKGFFQGNSPRKRHHITEKPIEVLRELVRIVPEGGTLLDPFAGAGTTGRAALIEGRNFIGCETVEHYVDVARQRIAEVSGTANSGDGQLRLSG